MKNFFTKYILAALFLLLIFISTEIGKTPPSDSADIFFLNVGQGDSELIQKGNFQILIDGGPDDSVLTELGDIMPLSDRKIDVIVLTHPHADHLAGLNLILERYEVGQIYGSGVLDTTNGYIEFLSKLKSKKINLQVSGINTKIIPFENSELDFLWPGDRYLKQDLSNLNNSSLVTKFCYFSYCALFTGDIETDEQTAMFDYYKQRNSLSIFDVEIIKVAHHGSSNGTDENILRYVQPKYAVIEVGEDNKYGHPHASTLNLLKKFNTKVYRTNKDSTIKFELSKTGITKD